MPWDDRKDMEKAKDWLKQNPSVHVCGWREMTHALAKLITEVRTDAEHRTAYRALNHLRDEAFTISKEHGFHEREKSMGEYVALIHSEVSEAFEDFRNGESLNELWYQTVEKTRSKSFEGIDPKTEQRRLNKPCGIPSEMADVIIRVLDFCGAYGIDVERAVHEKMKFNQTRPYKHGKTI